MDYMKIFLSILLVLAFYIMFGQESIEKLKKGGISISRTEEEPQNFKEPGKLMIEIVMLTFNGMNMVHRNAVYHIIW